MDTIDAQYRLTLRAIVKCGSMNTHRPVVLSTRRFCRPYRCAIRLL